LTDENRLDKNQLKIYVYLIERNKPASVREIATATGLAPSSVHYHLKKMIESGLVKRTPEGYTPARIIGIEGYLVIGRKILPRIMIYGFFFLGIFIGETLVSIIEGFNIDRLTAIMISWASSAIFFLEGLRIKKELFSPK